MKTYLNMPEGLFKDLMAHLLPPEGVVEEAAFLFVKANESESNICFEVIETAKLEPNDFDLQFSDYLELADDTRASLIKRAHDLEAALVEIHSHVSPFSATFSFSDRAGLKETVPYMWWRLKNRPYIAIVLTATGFDALVWLDNPKIPQQLDGIIAGGRLLLPTNNSLRGWKWPTYQIVIIEIRCFLVPRVSVGYAVSVSQ